MEAIMAPVMLMHWPEVRKAQYEQIRKKVNVEEETPQGAKFHVAWFGEDGLHVLDLWDSREAFEHFLEQRLMPAVQKLGIQGQSKVQFAQAHAMFAPNV
jgi:hypothetical protein